ncbi:Short-chain dehydrogenase TIC 32, chloroplastic [Tolypocladium ophioglossoides CBS 100239]|uniref:3beta-hydroxysteroid 3-dehydrogenase n=1 Tax=Tolypocladium ophioglossoides (strain CBS 100239) TaxID=1163406 RepID=A0A0L0N6A2_TOLOC|nr:Short-chain dehydrogenase TIC 32, chloroplastic [Tolypocladium ophioglossoides CBS 100239]
MSSSTGSILVTGANGGLGSATVKHILKTPDLASKYTGLYTVRKAATASQLRAALNKAPSGHKHETLELDLSSLKSVKATAADINGRVATGALPPIRALILNAGYQEHATLTMSGDGLEMTWQVNFLANLVLSLMLLQSMDKDEGRILILGSWAHDSQDERNTMGGNAVYKDPKWQNLFPGPEALAKGTWSTPKDDASSDSGFRRYGASKLCAVMLMHELGDRIAKDPKLSNISVLGLDPGGMPSDISRRASFMTATLIMKVIVPLLALVMVRLSPNGAVRPLWKSAADVIRACFEVKAPRGKALYLNGTDEFETAKDAQDAKKRKALWEYGLKVADIKPGDTVLVDWQ